MHKKLVQTFILLFTFYFFLFHILVIDVGVTFACTQAQIDCMQA